MRRIFASSPLVLALTLALGACGPASDAPANDPAHDDAEAMGGTEASAEASAAGDVRITSPAQGATVEGPEVTVTLDALSVEIVPAGDTTGGTGHHHLYLDADLTPAGEPVPSVPGSIIHMGDGSSTYTFTEVAPGEHRLIAVVADGVHVPLQPWVVDTVTFTVR